MLRKKVQELWRNLSSRKFGDIILYTVFWLFLAGLILFIFNKNGKSFLWMNDGVYQHFSSFNYLCDYLKDLISNFHFSGFFDFTLGQGMDILTTLNSYDFTDPISILCALVFPLSRAGRYTLMIFIKLYLIGISFLFYCHVTEHEKTMAIVGGALAYVFCGAVLIMFARHPNYINWAYFFPFLLGGVELYFRKQKKLPLILFVFLNLITSYYTFYMNAILVAIYVLVHVICKVVKEKKWSVLKEELFKCLKLAGVCCIGVLLSSCVLFPTIYAYLNGNRIGELTGYSASAFVYEEEFYKDLFEDLFAPFKYEGNTSSVGFNAVLIIPLILIFTKRKQYTEIKSLFLLSLFMMGIPIVGRIMNGFGYATNRWAYVVPFYASVIFVLMFTEVQEMTEKEKAFVFLTVIAYIVLCYSHTETNTDSLKSVTMVALVAVVVAVAVALYYHFPSMEPFLFSLLIVGACFQIYFTFSEDEANYVNQYLAKDEVTSSYADVSSTAAGKVLDDTDFYRTEMQETKKNVNGKNKVNGTGFWWSTVSGSTMDYYTELSVDSVSTNCSAGGGLDGRSALLELASVKYYTRPTEEDGLIPCGYEEVPSADTRYQIFENQYALPIGYTYANYISLSEYEEMNGIEKEQALMQAAVLEENINGITKAEINLDYQSLDYEIIRVDGMTVTNDCIKITNTAGGIDLRVNVPVDCEIYVYITDTELGDSVDEMSLTVTRTSEDCSISKQASISNLNYYWPSLRDDVAFNLGSGYTGENIITLKFNKEAELSYNNIQVIAVPMSQYIENAEKLGEYVLENIEMGDDQICGTISIPEDRILQLSVPYSDGWKAYVDGEEVSVMKSDTMYMSILVSAGDHSIEFRYETPYLHIGILVTIMTAVLFAVYELIRRRKCKQKGVANNGK